ncbi:hypothetical protein BS78_K227000 [Paspalum vaginatum]|uniref:Uncharacterized protein n=1 Tax=Paspalum vaginatum TaxID=158149 RepID=A0A9W8CCZ1_9POAL|nr:hypothetical protein BS78_K227000 [Paspalum vaginatum]
MTNLLVIYYEEIERGFLCMFFLLSTKRKVLVHSVGSLSGMAFTLQVPTKPILEQFTTMLGLAVPTFSGHQGSDGYDIVGVQVGLGAGASVPYLDYEAAGPTVADAEQTASLMAIHALAAEYQVELQGINYPQVMVQRQQIATLQERVHDVESLCCELLSILRTGENDRTFWSS